MLDVATAAGSLLAAFGLSGAAGLNAWIPLLAVGLLSRAGQLELADGYDALASTPGLIALGVLCAFDFIGDKVPAVDSLLHAAGTIVHPLAGAIVFAAPTEVPTGSAVLSVVAVFAPILGAICVIALVAVAGLWWRRIRRSRRRRGLG